MQLHVHINRMGPIDTCCGASSEKLELLRTVKECEVKDEKLYINLTEFGSLPRFKLLLIEF